MEDEVSEKEKMLFESIQSSIENIVSEKMVQMSNHPEMRLYNNIENMAEQQVFNFIDLTIKERMENGKAFTNLLKNDDFQVYGKLVEMYTPHIEKINADITYHELQVMNKVKVPEELLQQVYTIGVNHFTSGRIENALVYFSYLADLISERDQIWLLKGMCEQNLRKLEQACKSYETCISLNPDLYIAYLHIIECCILSYKFKEAKLLYETFLSEIDLTLLANDPLINEKMQKIKDFLEKTGD